MKMNIHTIHEDEHTHTQYMKMNVTHTTHEDVHTQYMKMNVTYNT